ncbi:unnamed protein product, partial [Closterium sp. Naga37s-1]
MYPPSFRPLIPPPIPHPPLPYIPLLVAHLPPLLPPSPSRFSPLPFPSLLQCIAAGRPDTPVVQGATPQHHFQPHHPLQGIFPTCRISPFLHAALPSPIAYANGLFPPLCPPLLPSCPPVFQLCHPSLASEPCSLASELAGVWVVGGSFFASGDVNAAAEESVFANPAAADGPGADEWRMDIQVHCRPADIHGFHVLGLNATTQVTLTAPSSTSTAVSPASVANHVPGIHATCRAADWLITGGSGQDLHAVTTVDELM